MTLPLIITIPHGKSRLPAAYQSRIALDTYQIWQMSDPFTDFTGQHPEALSIVKAKNHRIIGDVNRDPGNPDMFRDKDFYKRRIWNPRQGLSLNEKKQLQSKHALVFRESIMQTYHKAYQQGYRHILHIDHHNTAIDHPAHNGQYLPPITLGNYGDHEGKKDDRPLSCAPWVIQSLQSELKSQLPSFSIALNQVFKGSALIRFIKSEVEPTFPGLKIEAILIEWNLNLVWNPLSKRLDAYALKKLKNAFTHSLEQTALVLDQKPS